MRLELDEAARGSLAEQLRDAVVRRPLGDDPGARRQLVEDRRRRAQAGGEGHPVPALERSERGLERTPAGIAIASVLELATVVEGRRRHDRRVERRTAAA